MVDMQTDTIRHILPANLTYWMKKCLANLMRHSPIDTLDYPARYNPA